MPYFINLAIFICIFAILAMSLNLVVGYTGLLSVAHAAFYGIGSYTVALLTTRFEINFFISLLLGMVVSAIVSFLIGVVLSKFRGDYYALASIGFNVILYSILLNWQGLTRGPLGIPGIPRPSVFGLSFLSNTSFLMLSIVCAIFVYAIAYFIATSSFGRVLKAIRENEDALQVFGYRTNRYKLTVFVISAVLASVGGALFASYVRYIDPSSFVVTQSIMLLAIIIFGGLASQRGAVFGSLCMLLLPELLRFVGFPDSIAAQMRQFVYGLLLVLLMFYRPQGLFGTYKL